MMGSECFLHFNDSLELGFFDLVELSEDFIHQAGSLFIGDKSAFEPIQDHVLNGGIAEAQLLDGQHILVCDSGVADSAVVCIDRNSEAVIYIEIDGMALDITDCFGMEVTLDANLQGNAVIINVVQQITIFDQSGAMADAMRSTIVQGLVDAFRAIGFSGVDGDIEVILQSQIKGFLVVFGGMIILTSSQVKTYHTLVLESDSQLCQLERGGGIHIPDSADDDTGFDGEIPLGMLQAINHSLGYLGEFEPFIGVQDGGIAHFHVANVFPGSIFSQFISSPAQAFFGLQHQIDDMEASEVVFQAGSMFSTYDKLAQFFRVCGGKLDFVLFGELEDGIDPDRSIQMDVQICLWKFVDLVPAELYLSHIILLISC